MVIPLSDNTPMDDASDEGDSNTQGSRTRFSPGLQPSRPASNTRPSARNLLDGLGYLNHNADNLLGYLETVNTHLRGIPFA